MKRLTYTLSAMLLSVTMYAQSGKDSLIMNERSIDRAITLHRGQFRIEGGYGMSTITKRFDTDGDPIKLRDEGLSYNRHTWFVDFRYGIVNNLTLQVATSYKRQSQRIQEVILADANFGLTRVFEIQKKNSIEDLLVALSARAPFTSKALDVVVTGGIYIPIGDDQAARPDHIWIDSVDNDGFGDITYRYNSAWGNNALVATMGGLVKYRMQSYAFTAAASYDYPLAESKDLNWQHQLVGNNFEYMSEEYTYQLPGRINFSLEVERQLSPWFDLSILIRGETTSGGWNELTGTKVSTPKIEHYTFNPGYEILITPKLWLRQRLSFSLVGKNTEAPFSINSSLVYNFFPF